MPDITTTDVNKIDAEALDGLAGVSDSLGYKVHEIEMHLHSAGRWFGCTAAGAGPGLITSLTPFEVTSSASALTYGTAVEIFDGTEDFDLHYTPTHTDPHRIFISGVTATGIYKIRLANSQWTGSADTYATMADAITANKYTEFLLKVDSTKADAISAPVQTGRMMVGSTLWAQVMHTEASAETVSFFIGCHGYSG